MGTRRQMAAAAVLALWLAACTGGGPPVPEAGSAQAPGAGGAPAQHGSATGGDAAAGTQAGGSLAGRGSPAAGEGSAPAPGQPAGPARRPVIIEPGAPYAVRGVGPVWEVEWSPSGQTALVRSDKGLHRLHLNKHEVSPLPRLEAPWRDTWAGPDEWVAIRTEGGNRYLGVVSLVTGEWRALALVWGRVQLCPAGDHWVWVDVHEVRQGGAGNREIGPVYRMPLPKPVGEGAAVPPLGGYRVLDRGALLGRLADGSCLLDDLGGRLLLLRPDGGLQEVARGALLPEVTRGGRGIVWREGPGDCRECVELGPGVPFRRLVWWRLDGQRWAADLASPQVLTFLLAPDGDRLVVGHMAPDGSRGGVGVLGADGFRPGPVRSPALIPVGWLGPDLLAHPAGPDRWRLRSPLYRVADGQPVAAWLGTGPDGSLLADTAGEVRYLTPGGTVFRLAHPEELPDPGPGQALAPVSPYHPQVPYAAFRLTDEGFLLMRLVAP